MKSDIKLNDRVECDGFRGTVKYVGSVDKATGEWIGVEWDEPGRGKHNGTVDGKRYFETAHPTAGSLVRPTKLTARKSVSEALIEKYIEKGSSSAESLQLPQQTGHDRLIECVGFEKVASVQSSLTKLTEVDLSNMQVAFCEIADVHAEAMRSVETVDLSKNLLSSWDEVAKIVVRIPSLRRLILSYNRLRHLSDKSLASVFSNIKDLLIGFLDYDWDDVVCCACSMWSHVEQLNVCNNRIATMSQPKLPVFRYLNYLNLNNNPISDWKQICKLGFLPALKILYVENCAIDAILFEETSRDSKTAMFQSLEQLFLRNNQLTKWQDIAELNKLQNLEHVVVKGNPVFESEKDYEVGFSLVLSKIANLKKLNFEPVTRFNRKDSELYYMRRFYKEFQMSRADPDQHQRFLADHPRFSDIISKYGDFTDAEVDPKIEIDKRFLNLVFKCPMIDGREISKKIPALTSIANLKFVVRKMFKIGLNKDIELVWTSEKFECPLDKEMQSLNFYAIENGDAILVNLND